MCHNYGSHVRSCGLLKISNKILICHWFAKGPIHCTCEDVLPEKIGMCQANGCLILVNIGKGDI